MSTAVILVALAGLAAGVTIGLVALAGLAAGVTIGLAIERARVRALVRSGDEDATGSPGEVLERMFRRRDRVEAARASAELARRRLAAGLDELAIGMVICDRDGIEVMRNRPADAFAEARHGEALVGRAVGELLENACHGTSDCRIVELTQPRHTYEVQALPLKVDTEVLGAVALVRDITEELHVDRVRRDFVANVSHELKTPIGAVSLLAEALAADPDPALAETLIDRIQHQVQRLTRTVDDLMMLSYIEDGGPHPDEWVDLTTVVKGAVERISEDGDRSGIEVIEPGSAASAVVRGSVVQLESAVFNLLDNAVKYSEPNAVMNLGIDRDGDHVVLTVQDSGIGIPETEQARIFERFYRVDSARSRTTGGTGLGLSIVRHVALNHGGEVEVSSREGRGSTFTLRLPAADGVDKLHPDGG